MLAFSHAAYGQVGGVGYCRIERRTLPYTAREGYRGYPQTMCRRTLYLRLTRMRYRAAFYTYTGFAHRAVGICNEAVLFWKRYYFGASGIRAIHLQGGGRSAMDPWVIPYSSTYFRHRVEVSLRRPVTEECLRDSITNKVIREEPVEGWVTVRAPNRENLFSRECVVKLP